MAPDEERGTLVYFSKVGSNADSVRVDQSFDDVVAAFETKDDWLAFEAQGTPVFVNKSLVHYVTPVHGTKMFGEKWLDDRAESPRR